MLNTLAKIASKLLFSLSLSLVYSTPGASPQSASDYEYEAGMSLPPTHTITSFSGPTMLPTTLPNYTTSAGHTHTATPQLFTSSALQYPITSSYDMMFQTPPYFARNHEACDGLPIIQHDTMNPIQFYELSHNPLQPAIHSYIPSTTTPYEYPQRQPKGMLV